MEHSTLKVFAVFVLVILRFSESKYRMMNGDGSNLEGDSQQSDRTNYYGKGSLDARFTDSQVLPTIQDLTFEIQQLKYQLDQQNKRAVNSDKILGDQIDFLQTNLDQMSMKVDNLESNDHSRYGTTLPISFSSYLNQFDQQYEARLGQGPEVIVFDKVLVNDGNGYDSTTGIFTVPISGVYFFSYAISSGVDRTIVVSLTVNGKVYSTSCADTDGVDHSTMAGNNVFLTLEKGQRVLVNYDGNGYGILCSNRFGLCTFSGFLLYVA